MTYNAHAIAARRPLGTIFGADAIENEMFYDDITLVLFKKSKKDYKDFIDSLFQYRGENMNKIPNLNKIFDKFKSYL